MRYKDLPSGTLFQYSPTPGTWETAMKAQSTAYALSTGETVEIHANKTVDAVPRLSGDGYRLGMLPNKHIVIFSQANDGYYFVHEFLLLGHSRIQQSDVTPIVGKVELKEQRELVDIILRTLEKNADAAGTLLKVLRDGLFQDFGNFKLT